MMVIVLKANNPFE